MNQFIYIYIYYIYIYIYIYIWAYIYIYIYICNLGDITYFYYVIKASFVRYSFILSQTH